jgi:hypothetical protein
MKSFLLLAACAALATLLPAASAAPAKTAAKSPFAAADTDGDGRLSPREYAAATKGQMDAPPPRRSSPNSTGTRTVP